MMKIYLSTIALFTYTLVYAQGVGINNDGAMPANSAVLDVNASDKGMLIPRISLSDTDDVSVISNPDTSLIVHNKNAAMIGGNGVGIYQWTGAKWVKLIAPTNGPGANGDVLTSKGAGAAPAWKALSGGGGGCLNKIQFFTADGTWTRPAGVDIAYVTLVGGGGGGGSTDGTGICSVGGGGGGGQAIFRFPVTVTTDITVTVGGGGLGGDESLGPAASNGADGGDSSFGTLVVAKGGKGGRRGCNNGGAFLGGAGGGLVAITGSNQFNDTQVSADGFGSTGGFGASVQGTSSIFPNGSPCGAYGGGDSSNQGSGGGASSFGPGGDFRQTPSGYGGGGGGASTNGGPAVKAGDGAPGFVMVQWNE